MMRWPTKLQLTLDMLRKTSKIWGRCSNLLNICITEHLAMQAQKGDKVD